MILKTSLLLSLLAITTVACKPIPKLYNTPIATHQKCTAKHECTGKMVKLRSSIDCNALVNAYGITLRQLERMNPSLDCKKNSVYRKGDTVCLDSGVVFEIEVAELFKGCKCNVNTEVEVDVNVDEGSNGAVTTANDSNNSKLIINN